MRTLLIFPPSTVYGDDPTIPAIVQPLGLAYLAGYLERDGFEVRILDARSMSRSRVLGRDEVRRYGLTSEEINEDISNYAPDLVGISCMFTAYSGDAHAVARIVKECNRETFVVFGGAHASTFPDLVMRDVNVDAVVIGEGEATFLEIARCVTEGRSLEGVAGTMIRKDGRVVRNPGRAQIENLDEIPFPARHLLDMNLYMSATERNPFVMRSPTSTFVTSRGCPKACIFCSIQQVWGRRKWRSRSADNVVREFQHLVDRYGIREFHWMDDSAATNRRRLEEICENIVKAGLDIRWTTPNGIAHWELNESILDKMKAAGCYRITFGIESGNVEVRRRIGKPHPLSQAKRMIAHANGIGMWTIATFILGFPFETEMHVADTIRFAQESDVDLAVFYLLAPHPGTEVYEILREQGLVDYGDVLDPTAYNAPEDFERIGKKIGGLGNGTPYFSEEELKTILKGAYRGFIRNRVKGYLLRPGRLLQKIRSVEDFRYVVGLSGALGLPLARLILSKGRFTIHNLWGRNRGTADA